MALVTCPECQAEISTDAKRCPKCGAKARKQASALKPFFIILGAVCLTVFVLFGEDPPTTSAGSKLDAPTQVANVEKDSASNEATVRLNFCSLKEIGRADQGIPLMQKDELKICNIVRTRLGADADTQSFRAFLVATFAFSQVGDQQPPYEIAYDLMNVVEARHATKYDKLQATLDVAVKIYQGTNGHVTPKDLTIMLRSAGPAAYKLSDDGIFSMASMLWEQKKDQGE